MEKIQVVIDAEVFIDVKQCQRCQKDHLHLGFERLINPIDEYKYWTLCPTHVQPILLKIENKIS